MNLRAKTIASRVLLGRIVFGFISSFDPTSPTDRASISCAQEGLILCPFRARAQTLLWFASRTHQIKTQIRFGFRSSSHFVAWVPDGVQIIPRPKNFDRSARCRHPLIRRKVRFDFRFKSSVDLNRNLTMASSKP